MTIHYTDDQVTLHHGDCLDVLRDLPENSVDAVVTDPPYGLEFMGREWDSFKPSAAAFRTRVDGRTNPTVGKSVTVTPESYVAGRPFQLWCQEWATECLRILKPGGHLLSFGGSRTWHRLAAAVEDAGFEIRDSIAWLYGSGFPKSLDVSKAIDKAAGAAREVVGQRKKLDSYGEQAGNNVYGGGPNHDGVQLITAPATEAAQQWQGWGTALKPAFEPVVVARKPLLSTVADNVLEHGTGALNIDACRVRGRVGKEAHWGGKQASGVGYSEDGRTTGWAVASGYQSESHDLPCRLHEIKRCTICGPVVGRWPTNVVVDESQAAELDQQTGALTSGSRRAGTYGLMGYMGADAAPMPAVEGGSGGASRFFPTFHYEAKAPSSERPRDGDVAHPTVKPLDLMRWLVRLVTPPGGTVLEPFAGSGTTAEACVIEGFQCIAIEREADYLPLIVNRLNRPIQMGLSFEDGGAA